VYICCSLDDSFWLSIWNKVVSPQSFVHQDDLGTICGRNRWTDTPKQHYEQLKKAEYNKIKFLSMKSTHFYFQTSFQPSNSKRRIQLTEDRRATMSQHPHAHDEDGMVTDSTAVLKANAQEFLESLRPLYARLADLDALLNSEVELAASSDLFAYSGSFAAVPTATP
jgi:hypothetical protein